MIWKVSALLCLLLTAQLQNHLWTLRQIQHSYGFALGIKPKSANNSSWHISSRNVSTPIFLKSVSSYTAPPSSTDSGCVLTLMGLASMRHAFDAPNSSNPLMTNLMELTLLTPFRALYLPSNSSFKPTNPRNKKFWDPMVGLSKGQFTKLCHSPLHNNPVALLNLKRGSSHISGLRSLHSHQFLLPLRSINGTWTGRPKSVGTWPPWRRSTPRP